MLFLVGALLVLGVILGAVAHLPAPVAAAAGLGIALWLGLFAARERLSGRHRTAGPGHGGPR
ncbi:hypothetical protein [Streptomyces sp. NRRL F-2664]|uniref:hypothetical protein n=1 Tax=Streptomyces sp. NRRL F-2664 TaxID=1463842 RepID=UPI0004C8DA34|nr:hypothetical protein [Streptomyces sp. NRRL F-2664]